MSKKNKEITPQKPNPLADYKKRFGDRKDGRRLRTVEPIVTLIPFFMKERSEASNLVSDAVEMTAIEAYVKEKKAAGFKNFNAMHTLIAAYVRSISQKPGINRFVSGRRVYARNSIEVIMEVKKTLDLNAPATMVKFKFNPYDTAEDVYNEMNAKITAYQNAEEEQDGFDKIARFLTYVPTWIYKIIVNIMLWQDAHGILPEFIREASPGHQSMGITSMASLGIPSIYHHLYDFGNCPMFISFSTARHTYELNREGKVERKHYLDINYTVDDRICDGVYYASGLREIRKHLKNPYLLDVPPENVVVDIP
ncbi:MAG: hypothetical protein MJ162_04235 [Treponema sp.]|nr:hypothetical protein [Treponema sp.]